MAWPTAIFAGVSAIVVALIVAQATIDGHVSGGLVVAFVLCTAAWAIRWWRGKQESQGAARR